MYKKTIVFALVTVPGLTWAESAHQHGVADLNIAWSGQEVVIELHSPADNILGFEHQPKTDAQQRQLVTSLSQLKQSDTLFGFPNAANCVLKTATIDNPFAMTNSTELEHHDEEHSDISASYLYQCQQSQQFTSLDVQGLFKHFPRVETLKVQWVSEQGQSATKLTQEDTYIDFEQ